MEPLIFKSISRYDPSEEQYEGDFPPSMTQPGESRTVRELFDRWAHGLSLDVGRVPIFPDDEPDIDAPIGFEQQGYDLSDAFNDMVEHKNNIENERREQKQRFSEQRTKEKEQKGQTNETSEKNLQEERG